MNGSDRVAIVAMGGLFPGASDLSAFWANVKGAVDASSDPPPGRWPIAPERVLDPRPVASDRVPTLKGYYLRDYTPDLTGLDLAAWPIAELDAVFHLALQIGNAAWRSAKTDRLDRGRCGVILGNIALPTVKSNAIAREVLGPKLGLFENTEHTNPLNRYTTGLPAALLARGLEFGLGGFALDAACASSLYAIKLACDQLLAGRADAMIAGGLVRPDTLYTQMGFAQLRALSPTGRCAPFDERADGLVVGEGGCAFVLKRLSDAITHGDTILGVITGIGLSNDVEGNVLQPASEGQLRALQAAYKQAGWRPSDVQLIECHATGTPTGDAVEFESLRKLWASENGRCVIGGVKSTVGHLLTGAGSASLAKVLLAMRERTLPPTANFERPSSKLAYAGGPFRVLQKPETWETNGPRRAAINGFGFGGINAHLLVEEYVGQASNVSVSGWKTDPQPIAIVGIASRNGSPIESLTIPVARFRIPPKELEEMLPQQTLMLQVAAEALDDTRSKPADTLRTGVYVGVSLDPNTTNYHLRWMAGEIDESLKDQVHPALTANRTMGSLASIVASRVARFVGAGGPSFAVCDEEAGGVRAVALAVDSLRKGDIDRAIVGEVRLAADPRSSGWDRLAAIVLKSQADAERDSDRVYLSVQDITPTVEEPADSMAYAGVEMIADLCSRLASGLGGSPSDPTFVLRDRADGPFTCEIYASNAVGFGLATTCVEPPDKYRKATETPALRQRRERLFTLRASSPADLIAELGRLRRLATGEIAEVARNWWRSNQAQASGDLGVAFVAESTVELCQLIDRAEAHLRTRPGEPVADGIFYSPSPLRGEIAFVYPGSGNHFAGMGRELGAAFPHVLHRQMAENQYLASQYHAREIWRSAALDVLSPRELLFAQVALGTLVSDLLISFGVKPSAVVPYSLGESAQLYGTRAWRDRDEMFQRINASPLFESDLAGPCNSARLRWNLQANETVDWVTGTIAAPAERVREAIEPAMRVYAQIINTADDCVIGGERTAVAAVVRDLGASFHEVRGVSTAHCEVVEPVKEAYRQFHLLPTQPMPGVRYYSGAWGREYDLNERSAADAITAAALGTIDFPRVVDAAYADGARIFVEIGPGSSCTRMIGSILKDRPHLARAACVPRQDEVGGFLRLLANLHAEGVTLDLSVLYGDDVPVKTTPGPTITLPVGYHPKRVALPQRVAEPLPDVVVTPGNPAIVNPVALLAEVQSANIAAHDAFLRFSSALQTQFAKAVAGQTAFPLPPALRGVGWGGGIAFSDTAASPSKLEGLPPTLTLPPQSRGEGNGSPALAAARIADVPRSLDFEACIEFARGRVGNVLGPRFAEIDNFPTRVRLPDGPLQLVDSIVAIDGEPLSMKPGRVVTEHLVHERRWYLENGRIPGCVAIEAGQADLFLSGFLGIDFKTRGLACYRLLDAAVTFHRELPRIGELIRYDIHIDNFFRQGDTHLFRFHFDGTINGEPLLSMRGGCAGFFTVEELAAGKGVVHTALDLKPIPGKAPLDWKPYIPLLDESLSDAQVEALRSGDFVVAFGQQFAHANLTLPMRLPGGMLKLVHRVECIEPTGGRYGLGRIRCEADIHPDDWFLTCHFVDDQVMPGTLMYECCLHTLRVLLMRMGWVAEEGEARFEPLPGVASKLKCRGQVIATTKKVTYEVSLKEIGFGPEPYVICDALMYADGKPIVDITDMSLRMSGMTRERLDEIWSRRSGSPLPSLGGRGVGGEGESLAKSGADLPLRQTQPPHPRPLSPEAGERGEVFSRQQVLEFATGCPSKAFGGRYRPFDHDRFIARLPGEPFSFIDRVARVENCEPWKLAPGGSASVEYAVPPDAWYFAANRCELMPYSVLNEIALQACGWMAAYLGSALTSPDDLHFRNLGGTAIQHVAIRPDAGLLTTSIKLKQVSPAAGMIILGFDFKVEGRDGPVYSGDTTFGFFTKASLANQVGLKDAKLVAVPSSASQPVSTRSPFPDAMLRMVDTITHNSLNGAPNGLGMIEGKSRVNPEAWFFKAHFFQDPVWPGSLGLESLIQLLKVNSFHRWGAPAGWQAMAPGLRHQWAYRGQIVRSACEVTIQAYITQGDDARRILKADGLLSVDGRIIYQMKDFSLQG